MRYFFEPRSVAILGASGSPGKIGYEITRSIVDSHYGGEAIPINPNQTEILGHKAYKSVTDVPGPVDLAVIILGASAVPKAMEECGQKGVKAAVIISGGFKELEEAGAKAERQAVETARRYGIRVVGPNCVGIFNGKNRLATFFQPPDYMVKPKAGPVSIITQSGTYGVTLLEWLAEEELGASKMVSFGNKCDINEVDALAYFQDDPDTRVIAMYIEGMEKGREFLDTARKVARDKPVVALKGGRTASGAVAASSHTGSLAGQGAIFEAAAAQAGVIVAQDVEEMFDIIKLLLMQPLPKGPNVAMVTNGAGPCVLAADRIEESHHLSMATLSQESIRQMKEQFPPFFIIRNPVDITGSGEARHYFLALKTLAQDAGVNILMPAFAMQDSPIGDTREEMHRLFQEINGCGKTFLTLAAGGPFTKAQGRRFQTNGIPFMTTATRAITALDKVLGYKKWLDSTEERIYPV